MRIQGPGFTFPTMTEFQPFSKEQLYDPYPVLARCRREQPVFFSEELGFWVVTRYADINRIYGEPNLFSSSEVLSPRLPQPDQIRRKHGGREIGLSKWLVMSDPPSHTRLKKLMAPAFAPKRIARLEDWTRGLAHRLIDEFQDCGETDLVESYALKIPSAVMGEIIGAPETDAQNFAQWVEDIFTLTGAWNVENDELVSAWEGVFAFEDYMKELVADRRRHPADDLTTDFIQSVSDDGQPALSNEEVVANVFNVAAAGADTTAVLIAQLIFLLLDDPKRWEEVRKDRSLVANAIDETMRYRTPVRSLMRKTTGDAKFGDVVIPGGSMVLMHLASAGRDDAVFPTPDIFDLRRSNSKQNLGFGSRIHLCIGVALAKLEAREALQVLMDRIPQARLSSRSRTIEYKPNLMLPSIRELWASW